MTKVFISHPFTGLEAKNQSRAATITDIALEAGYLPVCPLALFKATGFTDSKHRRPIMDICRALISECDEVWVFGDSPGCFPLLSGSLETSDLLHLYLLRLIVPEGQTIPH